jgi:FMN phosphatase YigB (HAD superfamily)
VTPVRAVLLDFYCTLVDLSEPVRSHGFDDFARRLGLPLGPGEFYRRYTEMVTSEPAEDGGPGFVPYRMSWLAAGRRLLASFGRESAAGQFAGAYADRRAMAVIFPDVPDAVRALARHVRIAVVASADHDYLMRCLNHYGLRFDLVVGSGTARCHKPDPDLSARLRPRVGVRGRGGDGRRHSGNRRPGRAPGRPDFVRANWDRGCSRVLTAPAIGFVIICS